MKSILLNLLLICLFSTTSMAQDWKTVRTFVPGQTFNDVLYVNDTTAYAVSSLYNGSALNVKKTVDGGVTWEEQYTGQTRMTFREIATPNNGDDIFVIGNSGVVIHTDDGGTNWHTLDVGTTQHLRDMFFLSESVGYIAGDGATVLKTEDGGENWSNINATVSGVNTIGQIYFIDEDRGYMAGFNYFKETFDGGLNWTDVPGHAPAPGVLYQIQDILFVNDKVGYVSGDQGLLFKTTDRGVTWVDKKVEITGHIVESLFSIDFLESNHDIGFACGYHGLLMRTFDAGDSWELMSSDVAGTNTPEGDIFHDLDFWGNNGFLVGHRGQILQFVDTTNVSIFEKDSEESFSIKLIPNPTSDILTFEGLDSAVDQVQVSDLSGRVYLSYEKPIHNRIDCSDLAKGYYLLRIKYKGTVVSKPFVKN